MSKKQRKGKNAQQKKRQVSQSTTRGKAAAAREQRLIAERAEREARQAELLGAGVRARAKGTTMPMGVKILVGIMAFTMLSMMGAVSVASINNFDLAEWVSGEDVSPDNPSPTNSESPMTAAQRKAMDATGKFDYFYVVDEDSALTLAEAVSPRQTHVTAEASAKFKADAEGKRDEVLEAGKAKIQERKAEKEAREEAKKNNPWTRFAEGVGEFRDVVTGIFSNTWGAITGSNRSEESGDSVELGTGDSAEIDTDAMSDYGNESTESVDETVTDGTATGVVGEDGTVTFE